MELNQTRLHRIEADIKKIKQRIASDQQKLKDLEGKRTEEINTQILMIVQAENMTPLELNSFLENRRLPTDRPATKKESEENE